MNFTVRIQSLKVCGHDYLRRGINIKTFDAVTNAPK
jgi:hypothetical protein